MNTIEPDYLQELSRGDFIALANQTYLQNKVLTVETVNRGIVLPPLKFKTKCLNKLGLNSEGPLHGKGGVIDDKGNYVSLSEQNAFMMRPRVQGKYSVKHKKIPFIDKEVIYMNFYIHQWGHFLLDVIGRLWYILQDNSDKPIVYTCYTHDQDNIAGNYLELLELLGIDKNRLIMVNEVTQFAKVIIPESSILPGKYYTKEYKQLIETVIQKATSIDIKKGSKKIYCSRSKLQLAQNKEIGENQIEDIFISNGYTPVYMERLSLKEQISLLNNAEEIVLTSGSLAHNLLFLTQKSKVTILNKTYRVNIHQFLINELSNGKITFVDIYLSPLPILYGLGPFLMTKTTSLCRYLADNHFSIQNFSHLSQKDYLTYYWKWLCSYRFYIFRPHRIKEGKNTFEKGFYTLWQHYKREKLKIKSSEN